MQTEYLFVYGTLRRAFKHPLLKVLNQDAVFISEATFQGTLFRINEYPGAIASDNPMDIVYGEAYVLKNANNVLTLLDEYEECSSAFPIPTEYLRSQRLVNLNHHDSVVAWLYLYNRNTSHLTQIPSGDFIKSLKIN